MYLYHLTVCAQIKSGEQVKSFVGRFYLQVLNMNTAFVIVTIFTIIIAIAIVNCCYDHVIKIFQALSNYESFNLSNPERSINKTIRIYTNVREQEDLNDSKNKIKLWNNLRSSMTCFFYTIVLK